MADAGPQKIVWLASYPKSGNTWLRLALESLMNGGAPVDINRPSSGWFEAASRHQLENVLGITISELSHEEIEALRPRCYEALARQADRLLLGKVHDACTRTSSGDLLFPAQATRAVIYLVRDPRDVAVSYAHHRGQPIDAIIATMADARYIAALDDRSGNVPQRYLSWSAHAESWLAPQDFPVLLMRYEDMLSDFPRELTRVCRFLGVDASADSIAKAAAATRFETLQEMEKRDGFRERAPQSERFFRKGLIGGWLDDLTQQQADEIVANHGEVMQRLGYGVRR